MTAKIPSEIIRIDLHEASYKDTGCHIEPTYVNFFFGNNGAGKSTIAKAILSGAGVTYAPGRTSADYLPLVYNQDFIDAHFRSYRNLKGVFTLNAKNADVQQKIDEKVEERGKIQKALDAAQERRAKSEDSREKLQKEFYKDCWEREKSFREGRLNRARENPNRSPEKSSSILRGRLGWMNSAGCMIPHFQIRQRDTSVLLLSIALMCWIRYQEAKFWLLPS